MDATAGCRAGRPTGSSRTNADGLTDRQGRIVAFIRSYTQANGYPPSMREIGQQVGLSSTSSVAHQLQALARKGYVRTGTDPRTSRAVVLSTPTEENLAAHSGNRPTAVYPSTSSPKLDGAQDDTSVGEQVATTTVAVPLVGQIAAGAPITAEQSVEGTLELPRSLVGEGDLFAVRVVGDSMIGIGLLDGDIVTVRRQPTADHGDIVAAMIDGEATVKRLRRDGPNVWLTPENASYHPLCGNHADILGKVVFVMRRL
ncbi:transcriptional repressor LexA [Streptomyces venezuelae]|uniref:transcriptional repressor LexA n=1 Tax=Streptomyces venezuelae TaxID=54571 RepID=UPI003446138E